MSTTLLARVRAVAAIAARPIRSSLFTTFAVWALAVAALIWAAPPAAAQFIQQGGKLAASDETGHAELGRTVSMSDDGNTLIVGGPLDNSDVGAAWIFTRSGNTWSQDGTKLVGGSASGAADQGFAVAISGDGNTAIAGGPADSSGQGAAWIFTRSGNTWSQQAKLVGTGASGSAFQGSAVALSDDGNTAIVGGPLDATDVGAAWVFTRSGSTWTQQGLKLVGSNPVGKSAQGTSVGLSSDGNTAIVGGPIDDTLIGATWIFTRTSGAWNQQGAKLTSNDGINQPQQGNSVALSADGNTAIIGGPTDNSGVGAAWIFIRSSGAWAQLGSKLVGTGGVGHSNQGVGVAISGDGNTAIVGGDLDNSGAGAAWIYTGGGGNWFQQGSKRLGNGAVGLARQGVAVALSSDGSDAVVGAFVDNGAAGAAWVFTAHSPFTASHDFNDNGKSDILWRDTSGNVAMWLMSNSTVVSSGPIAAVANSYLIVGQRDFDADHKADFLWRDTAGNLYMWFMRGLTISSTTGLGNVPGNWTVHGTGDFNGDGLGDILWQDGSSGTVAIWFMNGSQLLSSVSLGAVSPATWTILGSDAFGDILWQDTSGNLAIWQVTGGQVTSTVSLGNVPGNWKVAGFGDFNGDGAVDILWRDTVSGTVATWFLNNGGNVTTTLSVGTVSPSTTWSIAEIGDFDGDGNSDILWIDGSGNVAIWFMPA